MKECLSGDMRRPLTSHLSPLTSLLSFTLTFELPFSRRPRKGGSVTANDEGRAGLETADREDGEESRRGSPLHLVFHRRKRNSSSRKPARFCFDESERAGLDSVEVMNRRRQALLLTFISVFAIHQLPLPTEAVQKLLDKPWRRYVRRRLRNKREEVEVLENEIEAGDDVDLADITDYDDVRYCCSGADVCSKCWPLMTVAIKVIHTSLTEDFGFKHILWVFSGRRGVHCWVCDPKARRMTNEQRSAVAEYFRVYKGNENNARKVALMGYSLHPFLARSYVDYLKGFFEGELQATQSIFSTKDKYDKILAMISDEDIQSELRGKWENSARSSLSEEAISLVRWEQLKNTLQSKKHKAPTLRMCVEEIVFTFTYPRIDLEVSKQMNHLLKAPFCVHPKTGRVCVPIDPNNCDEFDPLAVPTLSQLIEEINSGGSRMDVDDDEDSDTSLLGKSIKFFRSSFLEPLLKSCKPDQDPFDPLNLP
ncbi:hypothetical protein DY000_02033894 [Brassica cretica]|uniref:DNA primase n=1 Tax=Brassica cretica TaxID=69181 RepID=A0ABQ7DS92_BRACR|nr:hypothetical protein DY000_02033894 [Brassica cretica]